MRDTEAGIAPSACRGHHTNSVLRILLRFDVANEINRVRLRFHPGWDVIAIAHPFRVVHAARTREHVSGSAILAASSAADCLSWYLSFARPTQII